MPRITSLLAFALPLAALAACGQQQERKDQAKPAASASKLPPPPQPGQYRVELRINRVEFPGMGGAMADKAKAMFGSSAQTSEFCLTPQEAGKGREEYYRRTLAKGDCKYEKRNLTDTAIDAVLVCQTGQGMSARNEVTGTFTATGSNMAIKSLSQVPGGSVSMEATVTSQRIGDCS